MAPASIADVLPYIGISVLVTIVSHKIVHLYLLRRRLPPGPFPLPFIGNMLLFRKQDMFPHEVVNELSKTYGPVVTLFMGHTPFVFVTDSDLSLTVLKKQAFAGRPHLFLVDAFFAAGTTDCVLADYGKEWEALRRVGHTAARKYAFSPKLAPSVTSIVDRVIEKTHETPIDSDELFGLIMVSVLAEAAFGRVYEFNDPFFQKWRYVADFNSRQNNAIVVVAAFPVMRYLMRSAWKDIMDSISFQLNHIRSMVDQISGQETEGSNDTFTDAVLAAKSEAEGEEHWMGSFLHYENVVNLINDLFTAGSDTSKMTLRWIFLMMADRQDLQSKMRAEVDRVTRDSGGELGLQDREKCDYICAFINETMRRRHIIPFGVVHKTTGDTELNGCPIPKDIVVNASLQNSLMDSKYWEEPLAFRPERFLDASGKFVNKPNAYFIPFSDGRRSCLGYKLALNDMFLITARFLQKTSHISVVGGVGERHLRGDLTKSNSVIPVPYSLKFELR